MNHPMCGHDRNLGPDDFDIECCVCAGNPCHAVTVELMVRHRDFDIDLWSKPREVVGNAFCPPF